MTEGLICGGIDDVGDDADIEDDCDGALMRFGVRSEARPRARVLPAQWVAVVFIRMTFQTLFMGNNI